MQDQLYQEIILDHYKHPHGRGLREPYAVEAHHVNPTCGDEVTLRIDLGVGGDGGAAVVADVSYDGAGCSISQASASVLHDLMLGLTVPQALARHEAFATLMAGRGQVQPDEEMLGDAVAFAGVARYPARVKCALLAWMAFKDALVRAAESGTAPGSTTTVGGTT